MHLPAGVCCNLLVRDPGVVGMSWIHISTGNMMGFLSLFPPPASDPVSPMAELWGLRGRAQGRADVAHTVQTWASSPDFRVGEAMPVELPRHPWGPCATKHMTLCAVPCPSPVSPPPPCRQCSSTEPSLGGCPDTGVGGPWLQSWLSFEVLQHLGHPPQCPHRGWSTEHKGHLAPLVAPDPTLALVAPGGAFGYGSV